MEKIVRKSLIYKTGVEYGDYTLNHIFGCSHGCRYPCYAMMLAKRYGNIKGYEEWTKPKLVDNAIELVKQELPKIQNKAKFIHLCFTTDPFMYKNDEVINLSLKIISLINSCKIPVEVLTKGVIPCELFEDYFLKCNYFGITLVSLNENFRKSYEPGAAPINERIKSLKKCHELGYKTWVSIEPFPTPNIENVDIEKLLKKISFVDYIVFGRMNYNKLSSQYRNKKEFYNKVCEAVEVFCKKHHIRLHIKKGTDTRNEH